MSEIAVRVEGLGKQYQLGQARERYSTLRDQIRRWTSPRAWVRRAADRAARADFWALKDISFEVKRGEVVGIIGRNGAGKSTLLKILSRITEPTEGEADLHGRVGSLLEVGTGFHPELTGRENIFLNGAILGMKRTEIARKFDEIVAFAEVERFIDTPVKHYSSGMYMRLAFAVAAHLEPEILVVDEVLAVGDAQFQKKCLGKMGDVAKSGRTVLFVSHNMATISSLCERVVWLSGGEVKLVDRAKTAVNRYVLEMSTGSSAVIDLAKRFSESAAKPAAMMTELRWLTPLPLVYGRDARLQLKIRGFGAVEDAAVGVGFCFLEGQRFLTFESDLTIPRCQLQSGCDYVIELNIPLLPISPGMYSLDVGIRSGDYSPVDVFHGMAQVEVVSDEETPSNIMHHLNEGAKMSGSWTWDTKKSL